MALALNIGKCSLLGNYRENNEDSVEIATDGARACFVVADGLGGHAGGALRSVRRFLSAVRCRTPTSTSSPVPRTRSSPR